MRTVRPSRPTAVPLFICRQVGNTRTYAESHLERIDQLRAGQHPDQAVRRRVPQDRAASTSSTRAPAPRIKHKKVSAADGEEVPAEAIVKGYELASGEYVTVGDDELAALDPEASRTIDIEEFVDLADIDPLFYDSAYYVAPDKATAQALRPPRPGDGGVGQGRRRPVRDALEAVPLRGPPEGRRARAVDDGLRRRGERPDGDPRDRRPRGRRRSRRRSWTWRASSSRRCPADFDADRFEDTYRNQVLDLIERKAAGETEIVAPPVAMERGQGRRPHGRARGQREVGQGGPHSATRPARRRRRGAAAARQEARPQDARSARCRGAHRALVEIDGRRLKVSNLDKVLYPDAGFTKAEVIDYYVRVAPAMLPHIADRGVTLRRYPNGVDEQSFFEKRCPSHRPEWIGTFAGPGRPQRHDRLLRARLRRGAGVVGQHGGARDPRADGARRRHRVADDVRVRPRPGRAAPTSPSAPRWRSTSATCSTTSPASSACAKTSGSKGLQLYVPLNRPHTHEHCSSFAQAVAQVLEKHHADRVTSVDDQGASGPARCSSTGARTAATRPPWPCTRCGPGPARRCPPR